MTTSALGLILALVVFALTTTPSLLPRPWWAQGLFSGILMVFGYIAGFLIDWAARSLMGLIDLHVTYNKSIGAWLVLALYAFFAIFFVWALIRNFQSSRQIADLVEMPRPTPLSYIGALVFSLIVSAILVGIYWAIFALWRVVASLIEGYVPHNVAAVLAWLAVFFIAFVIVDWGVIRQLARYVSRQASLRDRQVPTQVRQPHGSERSGSASSPEKWNLIGREGKRFLGGVPLRDYIERVRGGDVKEPIRVYAALGQHHTPHAAVNAALAELRRTGAFERRAIVVVVPTGSGWVDEWNVQSVEYLLRGDCATVSVQYSFLPSWVTFVFRRQLAADGGRMLINRVIDEVSSMPPAQRPRIYVTGESLGSYGAQCAFTSAQDMVSRVDGAVWIGTPGFGGILRELTQSRHRGSAQIAPVVNNARHVRFATKPADLVTDVYGRKLGPWEFPRIVYAQHASDPVVWWHTDLIWSMPDWMVEQAGTDVSERLRWHRLITFGQLLCDLPLAESASAGHGHSYHRELLPAWRAVLGIDEDEVDNSDLDDRIVAAIEENMT